MQKVKEAAVNIPANLEEVLCQPLSPLIPTPSLSPSEPNSSFSVATKNQCRPQNLASHIRELIQQAACKGASQITDTLIMNEVQVPRGISHFCMCCDDVVQSSKSGRRLAPVSLQAASTSCVLELQCALARLSSEPHSHPVVLLAGCLLEEHFSSLKDHSVAISKLMNMHHGPPPALPLQLQIAEI